jgi:hypothetical protein
MIARVMQQIPPNPPGKNTKKGGGRPTPADASSALFSTGKRPIIGEPASAIRRTERSARLASDFKRALFLAVVLVFVGVVLYQFVNAL